MSRSWIAVTVIMTAGALGDRTRGSAYRQVGPVVFKEKTQPCPIQNQSLRKRRCAVRPATTNCCDASPRAIYESVIAKHGLVRPFANIVNAERRHEAVVIALMKHHDVAVPSLELGELPAAPDTLRECNLLAARLERDNIALYDKLLADIAAPDIRAVFENLRAASHDNHRPAFERWATISVPPRTQGALRRGRGGP